MVAKLDNQNSNRHENDSLNIEKIILDRASKFRVPDSMSAKDSLSLLKLKIAENERNSVKRNPVRLRPLYLVSSIAAGLLLFVGVWQVLFKSVENQVIAERGTHSEYSLPDGSTVKLNADSKITWSEKNFSDDRHISLTGEAFFDVAIGDPFTISTKNGNIKVLGTSFNVYARDNSFKVSCFTGTVLVSSGNMSVIITSGESAETVGTDLRKYSDNNLSKTTGWLIGEFYYENTALNLVFEEIERQFSVKFVAQNLKNKLFTGSFTNRDLRSALDIICIPMGLDYEIGSNGKISITEIIK
jgi:ferric-dicitrate binding protein FerR (iron transport regulator)